MYCYDESVQAAANIFRDTECRYESSRIESTTNSQETPRKYYAGDLKNLAMYDDIASVMVPEGYNLELNTSENLNGEKQIISGLPKTNDGYVCQEVHLSQQVRSLQFWKGSKPYAEGKWAQVTTVGGGSLDYSMTTKMTYTSSYSTREKASSTITAQMEVGVKFEKETITSSLTSEIEDTTTETTSQE